MPCALRSAPHAPRRCAPRSLPLFRQPLELKAAPGDASRGPASGAERDQVLSRGVLESMSRRELQDVAKSAGVRANLKSADIVEQLLLHSDAGQQMEGAGSGRDTAAPGPARRSGRKEAAGGQEEAVDFDSVRCITDAQASAILRQHGAAEVDRATEDERPGPWTGHPAPPAVPDLSITSVCPARVGPARTFVRQSTCHVRRKTSVPGRGGRDRGGALLRGACAPGARHTTIPLPAGVCGYFCAQPARRGFCSAFKA